MRFLCLIAIAVLQSATFGQVPFSLSDQAFIFTASIPRNWYNRNWLYRAPVVFDNSANSSNLTNYPVAVSIPYDSGMQSGFEDLRFTASDGQTLLSHWVEQKTNSTSAIAWVKLPMISGSSTQTNWLYYGNAIATNVSVYTNVFSAGSDFSSGIDTLTARTTANGVQETLTGATTAETYRMFAGAPVSITGADVGYDQVREMCILRDTNNLAVKESGSYVTYFAARSVPPSNFDTWRGTSSDLKTWSNFQMVLEHGQNGTDTNSSGVGTVIKFGASDYRMWYEGKTSGNFYISLATSNDGISWTKQGVVLTGANIEGGTGTDLSVPFVFRVSDGTYALAFEGQRGDGKWRVYIFTSSDASTWSALNSGNPVLDVGSGGSWDDESAANPKILEVTPGAFVMEYNGASEAGPLAFQVGFATASSLAGSWTKDSRNPMIGRPTAGSNYGTETSQLMLDETGTNWIHFVQSFSGGSATSSIFRSIPLVGQGYRLKGARLWTSATTDASMLQYVLPSTTFQAQSTSYWGMRRNVLNQISHLAIWDKAAAFNADTQANLTSSRRLEIGRFSPYATGTFSEGVLFLAYWDGSAVRQSWTGSAWNSAANPIASDVTRPVKSSITDDGSNYTLKVVYADTLATIATASIAKASVNAFSNGRVLWVGDPFTDQWGGEVFMPSLIIRPYSSPEPTATIGAEQSL